MRAAAARNILKVLLLFLLFCGVAGGLNLGWPIHDGTLCARAVSGLPCETPATASRFSFPVHEYASGADCKAVGALPYGGGADWLVGRFFFADACSNHLFVLAGEAGAVEVTRPLGWMGMLDGVHSVSRDGFGEPTFTTAASILSSQSFLKPFIAGWKPNRLSTARQPPALSGVGIAIPGRMS